MASFKRVSFSGVNLELAQITQQHDDIASSARTFFVLNAPHSAIRFVGYTAKELSDELGSLLNEHELNTVLNLLAALEASFRIDYLQRCYKKKKDKLSTELRIIHSRLGSRASLEDEILPAWRKFTNVSPQVVSNLKGAFKYRHWLAHGRYWVPKHGHKYDYDGIYILAEAVYDNFPLEGLSG